MPYLKLDDALVEMIEWARERLCKLLDQTHCGTEIRDADILWDYPIQGTDVLDDGDMEATHAVGFIAGVAAAFNVTPLELLDVVKHLPKTKANGAVPSLVAAKQQRAYDESMAERGIDAVLVPLKTPRKSKRPFAKRRQKIRTIK